MRNPMRITLLIIGLVMLVREALQGIPLFGGSYILSTGWAPLGVNMVIYLVLIFLLIADRMNDAKELVYIPILGVVLNIVAFIPFVGMVAHWIMTFMMLYFIIRVMSYPTFVGNTRPYDPRRAGETVNNRKY